MVPWKMHAKRHNNDISATTQSPVSVTALSTCDATTDSHSDICMNGLLTPLLPVARRRPRRPPPSSPAQSPSESDPLAASPSSPSLGAPLGMTRRHSSASLTIASHITATTSQDIPAEPGKENHAQVPPSAPSGNPQCKLTRKRSESLDSSRKLLQRKNSGRLGSPPSNTVTSSLEMVPLWEAPPYLLNNSLNNTNNKKKHQPDSIDVQTWRSNPALEPDDEASPSTPRIVLTPPVEDGDLSSATTPSTHRSTIASRTRSQSASRSTFNSAVKDDRRLPFLTERYRMQERLGTGAFAEVYRATERSSHREVAIKLVAKTFETSSPTTSTRSRRANNGGRLSVNLSPEARKAMETMYARERVMLEALPEHPNLIRCVETHDTPTHVLMVMELMRGGDLLDVLSEGRKENREPLDLQWVHRVFFQIVRAVQALHQHLISHRDLKLENVMFTDKTHQTCKLVDFGLSVHFEPDSWLTSRVGSDEYLCPEVIKAQPYSGPTPDLWSLGVILFSMLTGRQPFVVHPQRPKEIFHRICRGQFAWTPQEEEQVPAAWRRLVEHLLDPSLDQRIQSAEQVLEWEQELLEQRVQSLSDSD